MLNNLRNLMVIGAVKYGTMRRFAVNEASAI
jgi:hypothetical protein